MLQNLKLNFLQLFLSTFADCRLQTRQQLLINEFTPLHPIIKLSDFLAQMQHIVRTGVLWLNRRLLFERGLFWDEG
jgi:lipoprotein NlpI